MINDNNNNLIMIIKQHKFFKKGYHIMYKISSFAVIFLVHFSWKCIKSFMYLSIKHCC